MTTSNDTGLFDALNVTVDGEAFGGMHKTAWALIEKDATIEKEIVVELPLSATAQGAACSIDFSVSAVQGNASNVNEATAAELREVLLTPDANGVVNLDRDYELTDAWTPVVKGTSGNHVYTDWYLTINGNGHTISGLTRSLLQGEPNAHIVINDLTITDSNIVETYAEANGMGTGAFVGYLDNQVSSVKLNKCTLKDSTIKNNGAVDVGGLCGNCYGTVTINQCSVKNCTIGSGSSAAGIIGFHAGGTLTIDQSSVKNTKIRSIKDGEWRVGEIIGTIGGGSATTITNYTVENNTISQINQTAPEHDLYGRIYGSLTIAGKTYVTDGVMQTAEGVYEISNANGMFWFANKVNTSSEGNLNAILTADIDLENQAWTPIGQTAQSLTGYPNYTGTFDGNGKVIKNLKITTADDVSTHYATGLFGWTNGTIKNVTIDGATIVASHYVGAIAGYVEAGSVTNCTAKNVTITAKHISDDLCGDKIGGVVGYLNNYTTMSGCHAETITIEACRDAGVLAGCMTTAATLGSGENANTISGTNTITEAAGCTGENFDDGTGEGADGVGRIR